MGKKTNKIYQFWLLALIVILSCVTPIYDRAELRHGWIGNGGICYINTVMPFTTWGGGCAFNPEHHYSHFNIFRFDLSGGYNIKNVFGTGARFSLNVCSEDDLQLPSSNTEEYCTFDLGLWTKLRLYSTPSVNMSLKYDLGLNNVFGAGNLYLMIGFKKNGNEFLTICPYIFPSKPYDFKEKLASSGIFLLLHNLPYIRKTLMIGTNFFFTQKLDKENEPYIAFYTGLGF